MRVVNLFVRIHHVPFPTQIENELLPMLYQNLMRLNEENKEDADGVFSTLGMYPQNILA